MSKIIESAAELDARQQRERRLPWFLAPVVLTIKLPKKAGSCELPGRS